MFYGSYAIYRLTAIVPMLMSVHPMLIRGNIADPELFPELVYVRNTEGAHCTATIVGPRAILTAAHCVGKFARLKSVVTTEDPFTIKCSVMHGYPVNPSLDLALCEKEDGENFQSRPATVRAEGVQKGDKVILTGFGCTESDGSGGNDGKLRIGFTTVVNKPKLNNWFVTKGDAALCFGDSGGPAYYLNNHSEDETNHEIVGVNSQGDIHQTSYLAATYLDQSVKFMKQWIKKTKLDICGINMDCSGWGYASEVPRRPMNPGIFGGN